MADVVDKSLRSRMMSNIKGKDTKLELLFRKALHRRGYRYRLHAHSFPGKPDLVLSRYSAVIFINGCFWHMHKCHLFKWPSTRDAFWRKKLHENAERDSKNIQSLLQAGWRVLVIWECSTKGKFKISLDEIIDSAEAWLKSDLSVLHITCKDEGLV